MRGTMRKKFVCPVCGEKVGGPVRDTEPRYNGFFRYRECENCGVVFVTEEKITKAILRDGKITGAKEAEQ